MAEFLEQQIFTMSKAKVKATSAIRRRVIGGEFGIQKPVLRTFQKTPN